MKISKEVKEYFILIVIIAVGGWTLYQHFFHKANFAGSAIDDSTASATAEVLPRGPIVDLKTLQDQRFRSLVQPQYPIVNRTEVGDDNPFK